jgi:hypothetical protein
VAEAAYLYNNFVNFITTGLLNPLLLDRFSRLRYTSELHLQLPLQFPPPIPTPKHKLLFPPPWIERRRIQRVPPMRHVE